MTSIESLKQRYRNLTAASDPQRIVTWYDGEAYPLHKPYDLLIRVRRKDMKL